MRSTYIKPHFYALFALVLWLALGSLQATSIAISTSGGDNRNSDVDDWRRENVGDACKKFKEIGIRECNTAFSKAEFKRHLTAALGKLKCGDTLVLFFNGHGSKSKGFVFDKEGHKSPDRYLDLKDLMTEIKKLKSCVKLYVAWHACYSGNFILSLLDDEHVAVLVSSAGKGKKAHKKPGYNRIIGGYVNPRNWPDGFVGGLKKGGSLAAIFQRAASEAKKAAEEKGGNKKKAFKDKPQDYKRGHVERVVKDRNKYKITLKIGAGKNDTVVVILDKGKATNISGLKSEDLVPCFDVTIGGEANFTNDTTFTPKSPVIKVEEFEVKFHVIKVKDKEKELVDVYFYNPPGIRKQKKTIKLSPLPEGIAFCKWYTTRVSVDGEGGFTGGASTASDAEPYDMVVHIEKADFTNGSADVEIVKPRHLAGLKRKLKPKRGTNLPEIAVPCTHVTVTGVVDDAAINEGTGFDVESETFKAHIKAVNRGTGQAEVDQIERPARFKGQTLKMSLDPSKIPAEFRVCRTIQFQGKKFPDGITDVKGINFLP